MGAYHQIWQQIDAAGLKGQHKIKPPAPLAALYASRLTYRPSGNVLNGVVVVSLLLSSPDDDNNEVVVVVVVAGGRRVPNDTHTSLFPRQRINTR